MGLDYTLAGVRHEGDPEGMHIICCGCSISCLFFTGKIEVINGVRTYVTTPTGDYPKDKAVLFLTDILGIDLNNGKACHTLLDT